jgi:hypothetical protein
MRGRIPPSMRRSARSREATGFWPPREAARRGSSLRCSSLRCCPEAGSRAFGCDTLPGSLYGMSMPRRAGQNGSRCKLPGSPARPSAHLDFSRNSSRKAPPGRSAPPQGRLLERRVRPRSAEPVRSVLGVARRVSGWGAPGSGLPFGELAGKLPEGLGACCIKGFEEGSGS